MPSIKSLLLCATGALAVTSITQVKTDMSVIDQNIQTLTGQATSYTGGLTDALTILGSLYNIYSSFMEGATDASDLPASISNPTPSLSSNIPMRRSRSIARRR
ncbi:hypothetical protein DID88_002576 [Monilinia fructigena]|uniref:Uncharacterized protein n=1 Tax=Monilinia fructigena TaxID=38457 RepID=A0A395IP73_9HELO|nr:hypothetical protein DID88_002576 [Monilinia fructigena]